MQNSCSIEAAPFIEDEQQDAIFSSEAEMIGSVSKLCHGDLYVIGRIWMQTLKKALVGSNLSLIPVVKAAKAENEPPPKPPKMKYQDLPIYESPHYEYKDYIEDKKKCPKANVKILHTYLYPKVKSYRKSWVDSIQDFKKDAGELASDASAVCYKKKAEFKKFMRAPENYAIRQAVVVAGAATGFYIGSGKGIPRKVFFTSLGALAAGALCFPKETDEVFRLMSYNVGKFALTIFNRTCGHNITLRERLPCRDDMPPPPPERPANKKNQCPPK
ncbi:unnamed protein product [Spodoptera exigua]|uniref:MICOS complex subunit n=1 Tax=Spodoptera exigua TaxID=7107 RepID=A0A922MBN5_SPOEX|nr:hypothetical protein HF086_008768 [Spodoptera exigua]CAH0698026.1 unnamed protein product [Spodoptera exigua]